MLPGWQGAAALFCIGTGVGALGAWWLTGSASSGAAPADVAPPAAAFPPPSPWSAPRTAPRRDRAGGTPVTLADIMGLDGDFAQTVALHNLAAAAALPQVERLIAESARLTGGVDRRAALSILYARYADLDPQAAVDHLLAASPLNQEVALRAVFHTWARDDLDAAVRRAGTLAPHLKNEAGGIILLSRHDLPREAQQDIADTLDIEGVLHQVVARQAMDAVAVDPQAAWLAAAAVAPGALRQQRLAGVARAWVRQDPMAAMTAVLSLDDAGLRRGLLQQMLHQWSRQDPEQALGWAVSRPPSSERAQFVAVALRALAEHEPRTAFDVARTLAAADRPEAVAGVLAEWSRHDPDAAIDALAGVTDPQIREQAIRSVAMQYAHRDAQAAVDWLTSLPEQEAGGTVQLVFSLLSHEDPARAADLLTRLPEGLRADAASAVANGWADEDPQAAARWIRQLPDRVQRDRLTVTLGQHWARYDRDAAVRYAQRSPERREHDAVIAGIIQSQHGDLAFAEALYRRLRLDEYRAMAAQTLYFQLRRFDPNRAEPYREAAGIDPMP